MNVRTVALRWAAGALCVVFGALMLVVPEQFRSPAYAALQPDLPGWGAAFLLAGAALVAAVAWSPPRPVLLAVHVAAGAVLVLLALGFRATGSLTGMIVYGLLGLGVAAVPFLPPLRPDARRAAGMFSLVVGASAALLGLTFLIASRSSLAALSAQIPGLLTPFGVAFLAGGIALLYVQLRPAPPPVAWGAHLVVAAAYLAFAATSALPARGWTGLVYFGGFGIVLAVLPALGPRLAAMDSRSLRTRLSLLLILIGGLPLVFVATVGASRADLGDSDRLLIFEALLLAMAGSALAGIVVADRIARPLAELARATDRLAAGDEDATLPTSGFGEIARLAEQFGRMRDRLAEQTAELRRRERHFRLLIERTTDIFTIVEADGTIRYMSPSVRAVLGHAPDDLVGASALGILHPADLPVAIETLGRLAGEPGGVVAMEVRCRHRDGSWRWCEVVGVNLLAEPALGGILTTMRDITGRKGAEAEREEALAREHAARAQAEAAVRVRDEFLSIAAHELKTPMVSLRLAVQYLRQQLDQDTAIDSAHLRRIVRINDQQIARMSGLVAQLLEVSRLQRGGLVLERETVDVAELVRAAVELARARTTRHDLRVATPPEARAEVDPVRLEQVVTNLLDNAIKYSPEGGPIDVALAPAAPDVLRLTVRDRGLGIPPEHREHVFELFHQAHATSHRSGMGIGLYVSRQIVELHAGRIALAFPDDGEGGTCVVVDLPIHAPAAVTPALD